MGSGGLRPGWMILGNPSPNAHNPQANFSVHRATFLSLPLEHHHQPASARRLISPQLPLSSATYQSPPSIMAPSQFPPSFNPTPQDIESLLAAQCHLGSKNLQVHMESYLWKLRADGVHILNIGKTWYVENYMGMAMSIRKNV